MPRKRVVDGRNLLESINSDVEIPTMNSGRSIPPGVEIPGRRKRKMDENDDMPICSASGLATAPGLGPASSSGSSASSRPTPGSSRPPGAQKNAKIAPEAPNISAEECEELKQQLLKEYPDVFSDSLENTSGYSLRSCWSKSRSCTYSRS